MMRHDVASAGLIFTPPST